MSSNLLESAAPPSEEQVANEIPNPPLAVVRRLSDVKALPIQWLWPGRIARGKISMIAGDPGLGKSQLTLNMAALVSHGGVWPVDGSRCEQGSVILLSAEDSVADTIRPRLEAAGADLGHIHILDAVRVRDSNGDPAQRGFTLQEDLPALADTIRRAGNVSLVIIDPVSAYLGGTDSHRASDVRALFSPMKDLAETYNVAIVCVSHLNKGLSVSAMSRVNGSGAFVAAVRAAYLVARTKEDTDRRVFVPLKNNIGNDLDGLYFSVESHILDEEIETSRIAWGEDVAYETADEILLVNVDGDKQLSAVDNAANWLREKLKNGPVSAMDLEREAQTAKHSWRTVRRAKKDLGVVSEKAQYQGASHWSLPNDGQVPRVTELAPLGSPEPLKDSCKKGFLQRRPNGQHGVWLP